LLSACLDYQQVKVAFCVGITGNSRPEQDDFLRPISVPYRPEDLFNGFLHVHSFYRRGGPLPCQALPGPKPRPLNSSVFRSSGDFSQPAPHSGKNHERNGGNSFALSLQAVPVAAQVYDSRPQGVKASTASRPRRYVSLARARVAWYKGRWLERAIFAGRLRSERVWRCP